MAVPLSTNACGPAMPGGSRMDDSVYILTVTLILN
jgi:hypothetical protein